MTIHDSIIELNQLHTDSKLKKCYGKTSFETMW